MELKLSQLVEARVKAMPFQNADVYIGVFDIQYYQFCRNVHPLSQLLTGVPVQLLLLLLPLIILLLLMLRSLYYFYLLPYILNVANHITNHISTTTLTLTVKKLKFFPRFRVS